MALRAGTLISLEQSLPPDMDIEAICFHVLGQMLSALDYLASNNLIHRDVKPENILYSDEKGSYLFQLADLGLVNHRSQATTFCGTSATRLPSFGPPHRG